jgi:hypothetical protein
MERRSEDRYPYEGPVFFATYNSVHEGQLLNYSNSGLFIKNEKPWSFGEKKIEQNRYHPAGQNEGKSPPQTGFGRRAADCSIMFVYLASNLDGN